MILHLRGYVNEEMVQTLVDSYNRLEMTKDGEIEPLDILFSSTGGSCASTAAIVYLINANKDITTFTGYEQLLSNGFRIFFEVECKKVLLKETRAMYHLTSLEGLMYIEGNVAHNLEFENFIKSTMNSFDYLNDTNNLVQFTAKELELIKSGKDLWVTPKRLSQMLKFNLKYLNI